ncbi:MAG TPA: ABC transporter substrate-binding protein [Thermomicrobiales bacterium]|nr:ABC transporter substrate-binding protein [Thermomicrobiales bacterium]
MTGDRAFRLSRRDLARAAGLTSLATAVPGMAAGQATPEASPAVPGSRSITLEAFMQQMRDAFRVETPERTGGAIIEVSTNDLRTLQPHLATDIYSQTITRFVYEPLAIENPVDGTPAPGLADWWEVASDGVTYTFHLNPGAVWHDGIPLTAEDVVFSFDAMLDESGLSASQATVQRALASYRAVDDHTVELVSAGRLATFIEETAMIVSIVPKHIWATVPPDEWGSDPGATGQDPDRVIGSGPFRFVEWVQGDHVRLVRNGTYWDADRVPVLDEYIYQIFPDQTAGLAAFQTGAAELASIMFFQVEQVRRENPELRLDVFDTARSNYYYCNQDPDHSPLFVDSRVRQAMMYALDRDLIAETIYQGFATPSIGTQPPLSIAYLPDEVRTRYDFDPDMARTLLDKAGWIVGDDGIREKDGVRFSFETVYNDTSETFAQQVPYMQQAWRDVGLDMRPLTKPFPMIFDMVTAGDFDMALSSYGWSIDGSQGEMFRCDAIPPDGLNRMRYCNPEYDALDDWQMQELDVEKRIALLTDLTNIVNDDAVAGILVFQQRIAGSSPRVHNYFPNDYNGGWSMPWVWLEE